MAQAQAAGRLRRNFQGYTDDTASALIGIGASSISRFPQGFAQNASATAAHVKAIREGRFSAHKGHRFSGEDTLRARIIEALMCDFVVRRDELLANFATTEERLDEMFQAAKTVFGDMVRVTDEGFFIPERARPLTRMIVRSFDAYDSAQARHSSAV